MVRDSLSYLTRNTDVTYFSQGSTARALVEATNLEISRLQDYVTDSYNNCFISTARGIYLDLFGEMLGVPRITDRRASSTVEDATVRFYVDSGNLGARTPDPQDSSKGVIPAGTMVFNTENTVAYTVTSVTYFPVNSKFVYVPVMANSVGRNSNVGSNQLTEHNLASRDILVTNDFAITTGSDLETDDEYRYRLSRAMTARVSSNGTAVQLAASSQPGVTRAELLEFSRGAGTFDVLIIPQGNRVSSLTKDAVNRAVNQVIAFGISAKVREPRYVEFHLSIRLRFQDTVAEGRKIALKRAATSAVLNYLGSVPIGGEIVINQIKASVLNSSPDIKDIEILELCLNKKSRVIRNHRLRSDELLIPDTTGNMAAVEVI